MTARHVRVVQACQALFSSQLGQEVLGDLEAEFVERTSFNPDALQMAFLEGQRHVLLTIRQRLRTDVSAIATPILEQEAYE